MKSVISLEKISKDFDKVRVLNDINIEVKCNEVIGLVGENGAGKSTLMKILTGINQPSEGTIRLSGGEPAVIKDPNDAVKKGIGMLYQEGTLIHGLTIAENLFLGYENNFLSKKILLNKKLLGKSHKKFLELWV